MGNCPQPTYKEVVEYSQLVHVDALETLFLLYDYGEQGAMDMVHTAKLIHNMAENERIIKINMLRGRGRENEILPNSDIGKTVYIHHRTVGGTLTDVHDTRKQDGFYLAIDGRIYPVSGYDFVIVSEPTNEFEKQSVRAERIEEEPESEPDIPAGMEAVAGIRSDEECSEIFFNNGYAICSHGDLRVSQDENVPSLRPEPVEE